MGSIYRMAAASLRRITEPIVRSIRRSQILLKQIELSTDSRVHKAKMSLLHDLIRDYGDDPDKVVDLVTAMGDLAVDHLIPSLEDPSLNHRIIAAQMLATVGDRRAVPSLIDALVVRGLYRQEEIENYLKRTADYSNRLPSTFGLGPGLSPTLHREIRRWMLNLYEASAVEVQCAIILALGRLGDSRAIEPLTPYRSHTNEDVRQAANTALLLLCQSETD